MKRILGHKNANYWRLVAGWAQGQNIRDEGSSLSGGRAPQSRRLYAGMAFTHYIRLPMPIHSTWKKCVKMQFAHVLSRRIYPECIWVEHFSVDRLYTSPGRYWVNLLSGKWGPTILYSLCIRTGAVGGLHSFMYTFKQVGNSETID